MPDAELQDPCQSLHPAGAGCPPSKGFLEGLYRRYHRPEHLSPDPLEFVRRFRDPGDGEVAGVVAAALAYGRVEQIVAHLDRVFSVLGPSPSAFLAGTAPGELRSTCRGLAYRFHKGEDLALLLHLLGQARDRWGSLGALFRAGDTEAEVGPALSAFCRTLLGQDARPVLRTRSIPPGHPVRHLLAGPGRGGAAKRLCLFLRWMVRKDALDPGFWFGAVDPARLVIPLDTHVARVGRALGFTERRSPDWRCACQITEALRRYDPQDPVRYDFSLFRYGMAGGAGQAAASGADT
ncbi:MAG: TIGR02757 family protein [Deferrisomatales bacterium]